MFLARQQLGHRQDSTLNNVEQSQSVAWKLKKKKEEKKHNQGQTVSVLSEPSAPDRFLLHVQRILKNKNTTGFIRTRPREGEMDERERMSM